MRNKIFLLTTFFLFYNLDLFSQCAMCKAAVESNLDSGGLKGAGLNDGILFLMSMPYLAMLIFAIAFYYNKKTNNASRKIL